MSQYVTPTSDKNKKLHFGYVFWAVCLDYTNSMLEKSARGFCIL